VIDWFRVFQVSAFIWAGGVALFWLLFALLFAGWFEEDHEFDEDDEIPASEMREIREFFQDRQGRVALLVAFWPVALPLLKARAIHRRRKQRRKAAEIFGWKDD
jgi:hypothetical protein